MRSIAFVLVAVVCQAALLVRAHGADWTPDGTRILGDPAFLPLGGQVEGAFSYTYSANLYDVRTTPLGRLNSWDRSENAFLPSLSYGLTDDVSLSADLGWGNVRGQDSYIVNRFVFPRATPILPGTYRTYQPTIILPLPGQPFPRFRLVPTQERQTTHRLGAEDPNFRLTWRALDQRAAPVDLDMTIGYAPDIFAARDAGFAQTGSLARGGQRGTLEAAVSREMRTFTVRTYATFGYSGTQDISGVGGTQTSHDGAHPDYAVGIQTETRIMPWLALNLGASAEKSVQYDVSFTSPYGNVPPDTVKPGGAVSPYAELVVPLLDHRIVSELSYQAQLHRR